VIPLLLQLCTLINVKRLIMKLRLPEEEVLQLSTTMCWATSIVYLMKNHKRKKKNRIGNTKGSSIVIIRRYAILTLLIFAQSPERESRLSCSCFLHLGQFFFRTDSYSIRHVTKQPQLCYKGLFTAIRSGQWTTSNAWSSSSPTSNPKKQAKQQKARSDS
jgi:hypothetical protein